MFSRHIGLGKYGAFFCGRGMKHKRLRSLTSANPYVATDRVEFITGLMYAAVSGILCLCRTVHRMQAACGHRRLWAGTAGYRLPVDIEHWGGTAGYRLPVDTEN